MTTAPSDPAARRAVGLPNRRARVRLPLLLLVGALLVASGAVLAGRALASDDEAGLPTVEVL